MFKVFRINTKTANISCEDLKEDYTPFGGRGLIAKVMTEEVDPKCDPFGPGNKLIICTGLLAGSGLSTANRISVGGKSPLTGGIKEANAGGNAGTLLAMHGIRMLVFEDIPDNDQWHILKINKNGRPEMIAADEYLGLNTYALVEKLHEKYGDKIAVIAIGNAGERLYKIASMQVTNSSTKHPSRAAGRGGLGAVAGSKKIKAIVVERPDKGVLFPFVDKKKFDEANSRNVKSLREPGIHSGFAIGGTIGMVDLGAEIFTLPTYNFRAQQFPKEKHDRINLKSWVERVTSYGGKNGLPCQAGCLVRCDSSYHDQDGNYLTGGLEYETYALCGPNCGIASMDYLARVDRICDDLGVDTMEVGCSIGVLMDIGVIPWEDEEAALNVIREMVEGNKEFGRLMGEGTYRLGKALGAKRIPTVKGQSFAGYDPRNLKGIGVTYATSPMGADHTAGNTLTPVIDLNIITEGQVERSQAEQIKSATVDNYIDYFGSMSIDPSIVYDLLSGGLGGEWDMEKYLEIGKKTLKMERDWNTRAGFTKEDDRLPDFICEESSPATNSKFDIPASEMQKVFDF